MLTALHCLGLLSDLDLGQGSMDQYIMGHKVRDDESRFVRNIKYHLSPLPAFTCSKMYSQALNVQSSYAGRHQERMLHSGLSVLWEIEKAIQVTTVQDVVSMHLLP